MYSEYACGCRLTGADVCAVVAALPMPDSVKAMVLALLECETCPRRGHAPTVSFAIADPVGLLL